MGDPYVYPESDVLINKFGIRNENEANEMEAEYTSLRIKEMEVNPIKGDFDFDHLCKLHFWIFQDVYEWAGKKRTINIEKSEPALGGISIEYAEFQNIEDEANEILTEMKNIKWQELSHEEKAKEFSKGMASLWKIHSFREGNTRTIVTFCCQFAEANGFNLERTLFEKYSTYVRNSLVAASAIFSDLGDKRKPEYLIKIVADSIEKGKDNK